MTSPNRKRKRLLEKLQALDCELISIKAAPKGASNPTDLRHDKTAHYISRATLIKLLLELHPEIP